MWTPIRIKPNTQARGWKPEGGWFCYDTITLTVDLRQRYTGKQAAQKECDRRNRDEMAKKTDGKLRNPKRWYTVGYIDSSLHTPSSTSPCRKPRSSAKTRSS